MSETAALVIKVVEGEESQSTAPTAPESREKPVVATGDAAPSERPETDSMAQTNELLSRLIQEVQASNSGKDGPGRAQRDPTGAMSQSRIGRAVAQAGYGAADFGQALAGSDRLAGQARVMDDVAKAGAKGMEVAGNAMKAIGNRAGKAGVLLKGLGMAIKGAGAVGTVATAAFKAFTGVVDAFINRAKQLEGYSGEIASAGVKDEIRDLKADMREAQVMGKDYARLVEAQSRAEDSLREAILPIKKFVVTKLADIMEFIADSLSGAQDLWVKMVAALRAMPAAMVAAFDPTDDDGFRDVIRNAMDDALASHRAAQKQDADPSQFFADQLEALDNIDIGGVQQAPILPGPGPVQQNVFGGI